MHVSQQKPILQGTKPKGSSAAKSAAGLFTSVAEADDAMAALLLQAIPLATVSHLRLCL